MIDWKPFSTPVPFINMAARSFARLGDRCLKPLGFAAAQMPVLYALKDGAAMSQKVLAQLAKIEQPSMAEMLARMERDGLIRRTPDPKDGRSSLISLTQVALDRLPSAREALQQGNGEVFAGFSTEELATLIRLLQRLNGNFDRMSKEEPASSLAPCLPGP